DYCRRFPDLFRHGEAVEALVADDIRLRRRAGLNPAPADYQGLFGPLPQGWLERLTGREPDDEGLRTVRCQEAAWGSRDNAGSGTQPGGSGRRSAPIIELPLPEVGSDFLGFHLVGELGRGAFGRVFLAQQGELANRIVVLKVSTDLFHESQALAQLHHPHI